MYVLAFKMYKHVDICIILMSKNQVLYTCYTVITLCHMYGKHKLTYFNRYS